MKKIYAKLQDEKIQGNVIIGTIIALIATVMILTRNL